jgi:hypothetical protein
VASLITKGTEFPWGAGKILESRHERFVMDQNRTAGENTECLRRKQKVATVVMLAGFIPTLALL